MAGRTGRTTVLRSSEETSAFIHNLVRQRHPRFWGLRVAEIWNTQTTVSHTAFAKEPGGGAALVYRGAVRHVSTGGAISTAVRHHSAAGGVSHHAHVE